MPVIRRKQDDIKKVLVVGAGPAGMAFSLAAAMRGNDVVICDKTDVMGGTMRAGSVPPGKERIRDLISWYERELKIRGVRILLNCQFNRALLEKEKPQIVVQAVGAKYLRVITGSEQNFIQTADEALEHPDIVGEKVIIVGGGASGCETAEYFSQEPVEITFVGVNDIHGDEILYSTKKKNNASNRKVSIVEMRDALCADMYEDNARLMRIRLKEYGVYSFLNTRVEKIGKNGLVLKNLQNGEIFFEDADTVILGAGLVPRSIDFELPSNIAVYKIGDANCPGKIIDAIYAGDTLGRNI